MTTLELVTLRTEVRKHLVSKGVGLLRAVRLAASVDDDTVEAGVTMAGAETRASMSSVSAIGDGSLLAAYTKFLQSDLGKALIALITNLILG